MHALLSPLILSFILATAEIGLVVVLLFHTKSRAARIFSFIAFFHALWIISHGVLHSFSDTELTAFSSGFFSLSFPTTLTLWNYLATSIFSASFLYLSLEQIDFFKKKSPLPYLAGLVFSQCALIPVYIMQKLIVDTMFVSYLAHWQWAYGSVLVLFDISIALFWVSSFYLLFKKNLKKKKKDQHAIFILWALLLSSILFLTVEIVLPQLGYFALDWASPLTGSMWFILLSYSIIHNKKIPSRTYFTQTLLFSVSIFLLANVIAIGFTHDLRAVFETIVKTLVLVAFVSVGRLLITNIFKESERKDQVETLNLQLKDLNQDLEGMVTDRTKELAEAKIHSETILENLTLGIIEYDESFTILRVNKTAEQFLGIDRHSVLGKVLEPKDKEDELLSSIAAVLYPALSEEGRKIEQKEETEEDAVKNEIVVTYPKKRELQIMTIPLKGLYATETPRFVKLIRDVTHENMVDRSKSEFIKIAAHQLRTPLSGTKWALRAILDKDLGDISKRQEEVLQKTYNTNKNLIDIVNDFLNVTKIEEDFGYQREDNDIIETLKEAILSSMLLAKDKKIKITFKKTKTDIPPFPFDKIKILLAIKNVISNAIDYTPDKGEVVVTLKKDGDQLFITVTDSGVGISKEELENIFTKFYRTKQAEELVPERSGLGLFITKEVVEKHGGEVLLESKENKGTAVTIRLPLS